MSIDIWTTVSLSGFHRWLKAPDRRDYLRERHRHLFRITAWANVTGYDREIEFHDLQDSIKQWWGPGAKECAGDSCEIIATKLLHFLLDEYDNQITRVEVSEDGESGAIVWRPR